MKRFLIALLLTSSLAMTTAYAEIKTYTGTDEYTIGEHETQADAKERSKQRALRNAQEQAGVYIRSYSLSKDFELVEDEVLTLTEGILKIVGAPDYKTVVLNDGKSILIRTTLTIQIDTDDVDRRLKEIGSGNGKKSVPPAQIEKIMLADKDEVKTFKGVYGISSSGISTLISPLLAKNQAKRRAKKDAYEQAYTFVSTYCSDKNHNVAREKVIDFVNKALKIINKGKEKNIYFVTAELNINELNQWLEKN